MDQEGPTIAGVSSSAGAYAPKFQVKVEVNVGEEMQISRVLGRVRMVADDWKPIFEKLAAEFYQTMAQRFSHEGAYEDTDKWADLSEPYATLKEAQRPGAGILVYDGKLRESLTEPNSPGNVHSITKRVMTVGTRFDAGAGGWNLGRLHQYGTRKMPKRELIRFSEAEKRRWVRIVRDYLHDILIGALKTAPGRALMGVPQSFLRQAGRG
jgi:phage gpG-like protein